MARRNKKSAANDSVDLIAMFPWWVGVALAVVAYIYFHRVASQPAAVLTGTKQLAQFATGTLWRTVAMFAQYAVPFICLLGAGASALKRHQRRTLFNAASGPGAEISIDKMSWQQFELLVGEGFRQMGYSVVENGQNGPDGGIDLVLRKDGAKFYVQCKQWRRTLVGVDVVRAHYGVMQADRIKGGFVVTSGRFSEDAAAFGRKVGIELIDGPKLRAMLAKAKRGIASPNLKLVRPVLEPEILASKNRSMTEMGASTREGAPASEEMPLAASAEKSSFRPTVIIDSAQQAEVGVAPNKKLVCFSCATAVPYNVAKFCWFNKPKFGGNVFCIDCQKNIPKS